MAKNLRERVIERLNAAGANLPDNASNEEIFAAVDRLKAEHDRRAENAARGLTPAEAANYRRLYGR